MTTPETRLRSMTGYGRGEAPLADGRISVEVRSVNSRFLDVRLRLPRELGALEAEARAAAAELFSRGQIEVSVRLSGLRAGGVGVGVDFELAAGYVRAASELRDRHALGAELSVAELLALPGVVQPGDPPLDEAATREALLAALRQACGRVREMRAREGRALGADLQARLGRMETRVTTVEARADEVQKGLRARLEKRLAQLAPDLELDPARVAQEVVIFADRLDVTEETVRLRSHLAQLMETLDGGGPVGRKLEFLLQEVGREVNTIGSKALDATTSGYVVELKTELEKLREQVLNLE